MERFHGAINSKTTIQEGNQMSNSTLHPDSGAMSLSSRSTKVVTARNVLYVFFRLLLPLVVIVAGILITQHLLETGPQAKPMPKMKNATVVNTLPVTFGIYKTSVDAMGIVTAAQLVALRPQVSGNVMSISENLLPGGKFEKGDNLLQLDQRDYALSVRQQESAVAQAKSDLDLEEGNQIVARRELALLGEQVSEVEEKLMLRQPQLNNLQIALEIAEAKYEQAKLNLDRTEVRAPFNGIVQTQDVNIGTWVSTSTSVATLIGSDKYWVEVSVPEDQLKWISFPQGEEQRGSTVKILNPAAWEEGSFRQGRVIQLMPALESQGRMARLLIEVSDPLALEHENQGKPQLLVGSFVRVVIDGQTIPEVLDLSREYLRDGKNLWVLGDDGTLDVREVSVIFKNRENVLINAGISEGENIIVSSIAAPVEGMKLSQADASAERQDPDIPGQGRGNGTGMGKKANQSRSE